MVLYSCPAIFVFFRVRMAFDIFPPSIFICNIIFQTVVYTELLGAFDWKLENSNLEVLLYICFALELVGIV